MTTILSGGSSRTVLGNWKSSSGESVEQEWTGPTTFRILKNVRHRTKGLKDQGYSNDSWVRKGKTWVRLHFKPRTSLYTPVFDETNEQVKLKKSRKTILVKIGTDHQEEILDEWPDNERSSTYQRVGHTEFVEQDSDLIESTEFGGNTLVKDDWDQSYQYQEPRAIPQPGIPSKQEYERHMLTHMPNRTWCEICIKSKGKAKQSRRKGQAEEVGVPVLQIDYAFWNDGKQSQTCVSLYDCQQDRV